MNQNPEKDPSEWTTGDEPMTGPQASYLKTLCQEAKVEFDEALTKAQASRRIDELPLEWFLAPAVRLVVRHIEPGRRIRIADFEEAHAGID